MKKVKVTTVGNSVGIVLTAEVLAKLGVKKGDMLSLVETPYGVTMTAFDEAFEEHMEAGRKVMAKHRDVLRELAKR
ncbi:MAG: AbrB/MazE/SpoVT family DNA-binding domain-containing protein [Proteobacteria bacterium]|nr:AbrB/MazE/SpoVT family DNA-binding domain-containing protein [Pseudomonadota bacterium]NBX86338.1 AbrB/MazE/SpoVT family DNA-binding domain-containing protein [Pseudomonadota bacterium]